MTQLILFNNNPICKTTGQGGGQIPGRDGLLGVQGPWHIPLTSFERPTFCRPIRGVQ
jgi:hypothetical protein